MRVLGRALALIVLLAGVARAERFAFVAASASLYREPRLEAARAELFQDTIARVLGERDGGWVEVELSDADHCRQATSALVSLHAFVRREALAPVTRRTIRHRFSDGTSVTVLPGVVWPSPLLVGIPIPSNRDDVGPFYEPSAPPHATSRHRLGYENLVRLGGRELSLQRWLPRETRTAERLGVAAEPTPTGLWRLWNPCIEIVAQARGTLAEWNDDDLTALQSRRHFDRVRAGAVVRWPDGARAGALLRAGALGPRTDSAPPGTACYEATAVARSLVLCIAESDVLVMQPPPPP